jgi:cytochrome c biogenesis protein ResB
LLVGGHKVLLKDFEKVSTTHTLTIQYDPGRTPVYIGFTLLVIALCGVFFFSHQRMWAVIEPAGNGSKIYFGGNTNRNKPGFEGRFNSLVHSVTGGANNE